MLTTRDGPRADDLVFATRPGGPLNRHNVRQRFVLGAAERASERLEALRAARAARSR